MEKALGKTFGFIVGILFAIITFSFISCSKENAIPICKTCTVNVVYKDGYNHTTQNYIESATKYCNGEADTIKQGMIHYSKISHDGGQHYIETTKTRSCE